MNDYSPFQKNLVDFIHRYVEEIKKMATGPTAFFRKMRDESGFLEPTLFAGVSLLVPILFWGLLIAPFTLGISLLFVVPAIIYGVSLLFIAAIVLHGLVRLVGGHDRFESTYRCITYATAASFAWVIPLPFVNLLAFAGLFCTLLYFGLREIHELTSQQASLLLIAPAFIVLASGAILSFVSIWMIVHGIVFMLRFLLPG